MQYFKQVEHEATSISTNNLFYRLLEMNFFSIYEEDVNGSDLYLKFDSTKEKDAIYNLLPLDLKHQYHKYAANAFMQIVSRYSDPNPSWIYAMGTHFYRSNDLRSAIVCQFYYGDFLYSSLGTHKDALAVFEHTYGIVCQLIRDELHDDLSNIELTAGMLNTALRPADVADWSIFSRYSPRDMYNVCDGSNTTLYAILSATIRYGQCLSLMNNENAAVRMFHLAILLFTSSRLPDGSRTLLCSEHPFESLSCFENLNLLVGDSRINITRKVLHQAPIFGVLDEQMGGILTSISIASP